jgi:anti-sigma-K factor RskA
VIPANGSAPVPAGLFRPDAAGSATLVLPPVTPGIEAKAFGVTIENASGADAPTSPIILSGAATGS